MYENQEDKSILESIQNDFQQYSNLFNIHGNITNFRKSLSDIQG